MSLYDSTSLYDASTLSFDGYGAPLANMPAVGVYIAWTGTPYEFDPTGGWTDVTQYVRGINIRRGRQDDLQQFPPGTASLVLDNRDRLFDPFNTAGANYANLKPRKQIKIVANWAGVEYPLYRGYVAGWPVEYTEAGLDSTVTIDCFDLLGLIAAEKVPTDWVQYYTTSLNPRHYYQLNDGRGASYLLDKNRAGVRQLNMPDPTPIAKWSESATMGRGNLSSSLTFLRGASSGGFTSDTYSPDLTFSMWYKPVFDSGGFGSSIQFGLGQSSLTFVTSTTTCRVIALNGTNERIYSFIINNQDISYLTFVLTANAGGTPTVAVYLNGQAAGTTIFSTTAAGRTPLENVQFYSAQLQEVSCFDFALTADQIKTLFDFNASSVVETTTARMQRILATTSLPLSFTSLTTSPTSSVCDLPPGTNAVQALQEVSASEDGALFVSDDGLLTFFGQRYWSTNTRSNTSQMTFTDSGVGVEYDAQPVTYVLDADAIRNNLEIAFSGKGQVTTSDATSISINGSASDNLQTYLVSPDDATSLGNYLISIYKNPKMKIHPFVAKGQQDPSYNWPRLLALELLDRVTFKRTPAVGSAVQRDLLVQSIEHRITPGEWQTVVNGSTRYTGWFILGVSLLGSSEDVLL